MADKNDGNMQENEENFDYDDLINDISSDKKSGDEDSGPSQNLDNIALSELLGDDVGAIKDTGNPFDAISGNKNDELSEMFDGLDDLARDSIMDDDSDDEGVGGKESDKEESEVEMSFDETGSVVQGSIDDDSGDYASILSQMGGKGGESPEEPDTGASMDEEEDSFDFNVEDEGEVSPEGEEETVIGDITEPDESAGEIVAEETMLDVSDTGAEYGETEEEPVEESEPVGEEVSESEASEEFAFDIEAEAEVPDTLLPSDEEAVDYDITGDLLSDQAEEPEAADGLPPEAEEPVPVAEDASIDYSFDLDEEPGGAAEEEEAAEPATTPADSMHTEITGQFPIAEEAPSEEPDLSEPVGEDTVITGEYAVEIEEEEAVGEGSGTYADMLTDYSDDAVEPVKEESIAVSQEEIGETDITGEYEIATEEEEIGTEESSYVDALSDFGADEAETPQTEEEVETPQAEVEVEIPEAEEELEIESAAESAEESDFESDFDSDFTGGDIFEEEAEEEEPVKVDAPAEEEAAEEDDFLGLGSISKGSEEGGRFGGTTEVLFEGVNMDFDDQISKVTLAEVLLAQGKQEEALKLYEEVASEKGTTCWVSKRMSMLGAGDPAEQPAEPEEG